MKFTLITNNIDLYEKVKNKKDFKIEKIRILELYKGETLNIKGNITKINLEGNKK